MNQVLGISQGPQDVGGNGTVPQSSSQTLGTNGTVSQPSAQADVQGTGAQNGDSQPQRIVNRRFPPVTPAGTSWASMVQGSKLAAKGISLSFLAPVFKEGKKVAQLLLWE